jgi:hypothetical protein
MILPVGVTMRLPDDYAGWQGFHDCRPRFSHGKPHIENGAATVCITGQAQAGQLRSKRENCMEKVPRPWVADRRLVE